MIGYVRPKVVAFSKDNFVVRIRLRRRTKNHFNTMYLGSMSVGADIAAGLAPFFIARELGINLSLVFASMDSKYLRRPDGDVYFVMNDTNKIIGYLEMLEKSKERMKFDISIYAYTNWQKENEELVAEFTMGLSLKIK